MLHVYRTYTPGLWFIYTYLYQHRLRLEFIYLFILDLKKWLWLVTQLSSYLLNSYNRLTYFSIDLRTKDNILPLRFFFKKYIYFCSIFVFPLAIFHEDTGNAQYARLTLFDRGDTCPTALLIFLLFFPVLYYCCLEELILLYFDDLHPGYIDLLHWLAMMLTDLDFNSFF